MCHETADLAESTVKFLKVDLKRTVKSIRIFFNLLLLHQTLSHIWGFFFSFLSDALPAKRSKFSLFFSCFISCILLCPSFRWPPQLKIWHFITSCLSPNFELSDFSITSSITSQVGNYSDLIYISGQEGAYLYPKITYL